MFAMHELFYCSFAVREMSETDILNILETARKRNAEESITGILIYWARTHQFMQILEGDKKAIFNLLDDIKKDDRHTGLKLIYDGEIPERCFANWSMGFSRFETIDTSKLEGFSGKRVYGRIDQWAFFNCRQPFSLILFGHSYS